MNEQPERRYGSPVGGGEKEVLTGSLDHLRKVMVSLCEGLSRDELIRSPVPSGTSLLGLIKHLTLVERSWFGERTAGEPLDFDWHAGDPNSDFRIEDHEDVRSIIAAYEAACERSRRIVAAMSLDDHLQHEDYSSYNLRWVMVHMIEEVARHAGHADIIREQLDGMTGTGYPGFETSS